MKGESGIKEESGGRLSLAQVSQSRVSTMRKMLCEIDLEKAQGDPGRYLEHFSKSRSCNNLRRMP